MMRFFFKSIIMENFRKADSYSHILILILNENGGRTALKLCYSVKTHIELALDGNCVWKKKDKIMLQSLYINRQMRVVKPLPL